MRILSGRYRGRQILIPRSIRPTQDMVKKALFDILGDLSGCSFLEMCAGSGAVGMEAVSRGAREVAFIESNRECLKVLRANIRAIAPDHCHIYSGRVQKVIKQLFSQKKLFDLGKENGMKIIYHCDGYVGELLPMLIDAGIDCIQPLEVRAGNDVRTYIEKYPDAISYIGNINMDIFTTTKDF